MFMRRKTKQQIKGSIAQFVYGATDGTVTTFAVVAGSVGGGLGPKVAITLGFANLFADGISMGISAYLGAETDEQVRRTAKSKKLRTALVTFISFIVVGTVPLLGYIQYYVWNGTEKSLFVVSATLAGLSFIIIGGLRARVTGSSMIKSVAETLLLGATAATAAYVVGNIIERIVSP